MAIVNPCWNTNSGSMLVLQRCVNVGMAEVGQCWYDNSGSMLVWQ